VPDSADGSTDGSTVVQVLRQGFRRPPADSRPMTRWWWFGPAVERVELARELDEMRDAGIGGVEVAVVYPLSETTDRFLSATFLADLRFAAEQAQARGLRFDVTLGSGWSFGGSHVTPSIAARRLHWDRQEIPPAAVDLPLPRAWPGDELIVAYVGDGSLQEPPDEFELLPVTDGTIAIPRGHGPRVVLTAVGRLTGQNVKRAASGAEGPVLDHYSAGATARHIDVVCEPLVAAAGAERLGSVFCDSLEVYGADWTPGVLEEFGARRGYDPRPLLWLLHVDGEGACRLRADYYRTLTELYEENFVAPMQRWAASHGVAFRLQGYGQPPAALSSYRFADRFEGEGWGWKDIPPTRWASSAAQLYGREVVSSETWTWVHSPSFRATPLDLTGEVHEDFLCGVNQVIGHGWPYSPPEAEGIGWMFYAAGALDERNPWWPAAGPLNAYISRLSWLLRQGDRVSDVGVYVPTRDVYAGMRGGQAGALDLWRGARDHIGPDIPRMVREQGFDFDLFDDDAVEVLDPARFPIVVLPFVRDLPASTLAWLRSVERGGGRVLAVGGQVDVGTALATASELRTALRAGPAPDVAVEPQLGGVGAIHRRLEGADVYLVANTGRHTERVEVSLRDVRAVVERWDALSGEPAARGPGGRPVPLTLEAYEAAVLVTFDGEDPPPSWDATGRLDAVTLDGPWTVRFAADAEAVPVSLPHRWEDTAELRSFSGTATYTTWVRLDEPPGSAELDLGPAIPVDAGGAEAVGLRGLSFRAAVVPPIGEVAEVVVNGEPAGIVWGTPYRLQLGRHLRAGANELQIRVSNSAANALAADPTVAIRAEASARRYGPRFRMQDLDLAMADVNSGLLAVPRLLVSQKGRLNP
jgi:alpha-L-rhamnosidase